MASEERINLARALSQRLVAHLFPSQADGFDGVWAGLLPIVREWLELKASRRRFDGKALSLPVGVGVQDGQFWTVAVAVMVAVGTVLEILESGGVPERCHIEASVRKYANAFGAPRDLRSVLTERAPDFCLAAVAGAGITPVPTGMACIRPGHVEDDEESKTGRYTICTDTRTQSGMSFEAVCRFRDEHKPTDYPVSVDDLQPSVCFRTRTIQLGHRHRRFLMCLLLEKGDTVPHREIVRRCGGKSAYRATEKTSRRWAAEIKEALTKAGVPSPEKIVATRERGFAYEGPLPFYLIARDQDVSAGR